MIKLENKSGHVAQALAQSWQEYLATWWQEELKIEEQRTYLCWAVGGLGAGWLFPSSDIDLFIFHNNPDDKHEGMISNIYEAIKKHGKEAKILCLDIKDWDKVVDQEITRLSAALDAKFLAGNVRLNVQAQSLLAQSRKDPKLISRLKQDRQNRLGASQRFALPPDIKEGKGGWRDIQILGYMHQLQSFPSDLRQAREKAQTYVADLRWELDQIKSYGTPTLSWEYQEPLALNLGIKNKGFETAAQKFMRGYFRHLHDMANLWSWSHAWWNDPHRLSKITAQSFLNSGIALLQNLETFIAQGQPPSQWMAKKARENFKQDLSREEFLWIFQSPHTAKILETLHQWGLLSKIIPLWAQIDGLMADHLSHQYPVDIHSLKTLSYVQDLSLAHTESINLDLSWVKMAAFFHDIGKGLGGNHSKKGAERTKKYLEKLRLSSDLVKAVTWLVEHHLLLADFAFKADLQDPQVQRKLRRLLNNPAYAKALYILTLADISSLHDGALTPWRRNLLDQAWHLTQNNKPQFLGPIVQHTWLQGKDLHSFHVHAEIQSEQGVMKLWVAGPDDIGIFYHITSVLSAMSWDLHAAYFYDLGQGFFCDELIISLEGRQADIVRLQQRLVQRLNERPNIKPPKIQDIFHHKHKKLWQSIPLSLDLHEQDDRWVLDIKGPDFKGAAALIAYVLAKHNISLISAKLMPYGRSFEDRLLMKAGKSSQDLLQDLQESFAKIWH